MTDVKQFLASLNHPMRAEVDRLRSLVIEAEPSLKEHVKWNAPSFMAGDEDCITLKLYPTKDVQVVFHRGARPKAAEDLRHLDAEGLLKWAAPDRGVARFLSLADIEARAEAFRALVKRWCSEAL